MQKIIGGTEEDEGKAAEQERRRKITKKRSRKIQRIFCFFVFFFQESKSTLCSLHEEVYTAFPRPCPRLFSFHKHPRTFYHIFTYMQTHVSLTLLFLWNFK